MEPRGTEMAEVTVSEVTITRGAAEATVSASSSTTALAPPVQRPTLNSLPFDIWALLGHAGWLGYKDFNSLSQTSRALLHNVVSPRKALSRQQQQQFLCNTANPDAFDFLECFQCCRVLPRSDFSNKHRKPNTTNIRFHMKRSCIKCAIQEKLFPHMAAIRVDRTIWYLCHECSRWAHRDEERCETQKIDPSGREKVTICWAGQRRLKPKPYSPFQALPKRVVERISFFLDYLSAIRLSQVSKEMYRVIKPQCLVPLHVRDKFTQHRYLVIKGRDLSKDILPCYACFRIVRKNRFNEEQLKLVDKPEKWHTKYRIRCKSCFHRMYTQKDEDFLKTFKRYCMCTMCFRIKLRGERCGECQERRTLGHYFPRRGAERVDIWADLGDFNLVRLFDQTPCCKKHRYGGRCVRSQLAAPTNFHYTPVFPEQVDNLSFDRYWQEFRIHCQFPDRLNPFDVAAKMPAWRELGPLPIGRPCPLRACHTPMIHPAMTRATQFSALRLGAEHYQEWRNARLEQENAILEAKKAVPVLPACYKVDIQAARSLPNVVASSGWPETLETVLREFMAPKENPGAEYILATTSPYLLDEKIWSSRKFLTPRKPRPGAKVKTKATFKTRRLKK